MSFIALFAALAVAGPVQSRPFIPPATPFEPPMVSLPHALLDSRRWETPVQVCAYVEDRAVPENGESILRGGQYWLYVKPAGSPLSGETACVTRVSSSAATA